MGYDIRISRNQDWWDDTGGGIALEEWETYAQDDPAIRFERVVEATLPDGSTLRHEGEGLAVWFAHVAPSEDGNEVPLHYWNGSIVAKNPEPDARRTMYRIAADLGALVVGEEGELYDRDGNQAGSSDNPSPPALKPWWKFW